MGPIEAEVDGRRGRRPTPALALERLGVTRLRFETSVDNPGNNRYLQSFDLKLRRLLLEEPDGMALPGEFNVYELSLARDDAAGVEEAGSQKRA